MGAQDPSKGVILVVDDNEDIRILVSRILGKHYNIVQAENGKEALDVLEKREVDVIILDENMPVMSGHECYKKLRATSNITPVIFHTGAPSDESHKRELTLGAFDYVAKPVDPSNLVALVNEAFSAKQRMSAIQARRG